jgi:hypothetical protein
MIYFLSERGDFMKNSNIIMTILAAAIILSGVGFGVYLASRSFYETGAGFAATYTTTPPALDFVAIYTTTPPALEMEYPPYDYTVMTFIPGVTYVIENPHVAPQQDVFSALEMFRLNGFSQPDRIDNVQLSILPDDGSIVVFEPEKIQRAFYALGEIRLTSIGANNVSANDERVTIDFQFTEPNESVWIDMFGQVFILGNGPFVLAEGSTEQPFVDLFIEFSADRKNS